MTVSTEVQSSRTGWAVCEGGKGPTSRVESGGEDREDWEEDGGVGGLPEDDTEGGEGVGGARDDG